MIKINIPGSKSITQRALICASLAQGLSLIKNALFSEDTLLLAEGLKKLGINITLQNNYFKVINSSGKFVKDTDQEIYMENNGTGFRFLTTISGFYPGKVILTGNSRMQQRPIKDLVDALKNLGFNISYIKNQGFPPIKINQFNKLGNSVEIDTSKSSQFLSSLLLAGVLFKNGLKIKAKDKIVSSSYVDITINLMKNFGVNVAQKDSTFYIPAHSNYIARGYVVESDFSSASYFIAAPYFINKSIAIENLDFYSSLQGDKFFIDIIKKMGAKIDINKNKITIYPSMLSGITVDMNKMPDMVPTLAVLAGIANGKTIIKNIEHLKYKETNRIESVVKNLNKIGIKAEYGTDFIKIYGNNEILPTQIDPENDHRIAMSFALFNLINSNIKILNKNCVKKSFPTFWDEFKKLKE